MDVLITTKTPKQVSERQACNVLGVCRNSLRAARARSIFCGPISPYRKKCVNRHQPRALTQSEREDVKDILTSDEYQDQPPKQVYYDLLQKGIYLCSESTRIAVCQ